MFKVFNRGHKVQLNDTDISSSSTKLPASHYKRQGSLRHSHYFGHADNYCTLSSIKSFGVPKQNAPISNSKKYVSCENVRHITDEFQDVIDEDSGEEENGLKDKLVKRYNSLTTLLMKSFRKAKIKKKKEAMLNESRLETNYEDSSLSLQNPKPERGDRTLERKEKIEKTNNLSLNNSNNVFKNIVRKESIKSNDQSSRINVKPVSEKERNSLSKKSIEYKEKPTISKTSLSNISNTPSTSNNINNTSKFNSKYLNDDEIDEEDYDLDDDDHFENKQKYESDEEEEETNDSTPVFLGVKLISNEFIDLKPSLPGRISPISISNKSNISNFARQSAISNFSKEHSKAKTEKFQLAETNSLNEYNNNPSVSKQLMPTSSTLTRKNETNSNEANAFNAQYSNNNNNKIKLSPSFLKKANHNDNYDSHFSSKLSLNQTIINAIYDSPFSKTTQQNYSNSKQPESPRLAFNSHTKPQAPKPPIQEQSPVEEKQAPQTKQSTQFKILQQLEQEQEMENKRKKQLEKDNIFNSNNNANNKNIFNNNSASNSREEHFSDSHFDKYFSSEKNSLDSDNKKSTVNVKRSKTFTQQLQDILTERKKNVAQQQNLDTESDAESELKFTKQPDNLNFSKFQLHEEKIEKLIPPPQLPKIEIPIKEENFISETQKPLTSYNNIGLNSSSFLNDNFYETNYMKQIKLFNESSSKLIENESFHNTNYYELNDVTVNNIVTPAEKEDTTNTDDFKDLVHVLARQDNDFKKKFFDCLMTKLWDTTLPYSEYIQLNKLMTALFGESYHKMDMNFANQRKNTNANTTATNNQSNRMSKLDAEHIVNLMKIYLESNNTENVYPNMSKKPTFPKEEFDLEYSSVSNLINTLKRRQKYDTLAIQVENFNCRFDKLMKQEIKPKQLDENEVAKFNFLNGFDMTKNEPEINKQSLVVQLDQQEKQLLEKYYDLDYSKENMSKSQVIDKNEDETNNFSRNRLRKTLGNYYNSTITRRPPPPPIVNPSPLTPNNNQNLKSSPKINEQIPAKPKQETNIPAPYESPYVNQKQMSTLERHQTVYKLNTNQVKSSGIIASFQPVSQFIAPNISSINSPPSSTKRNSSLTGNNTENKNEYNDVKIIREKPKIGPSSNVMHVLPSPPKPKVAQNNQQQDRDELQRKLTKIRSVRELFKNEDTANHLIYAKPECLKKTDIIVNKNENLIYSQIEKKRSISSNATNKYLISSINENKNLANNKIVNSPYSKNPVGPKSAIYTTLGTRKVIAQEPIYYKSKQITNIHHYEKKPIKTFFESNIKEPTKYIPEKNNNYNHLSDLISNKFYKYDGREMKQAYY